jgi:hypothetical protein
VDPILSIVFFWATRDLPVGRQPNLLNSRSKQAVNPGSGPLEVQLVPMGAVPSSQKKKNSAGLILLNQSHVSMCPFRYKSVHCCSFFFLFTKGIHCCSFHVPSSLHTEYIIQHTESINSVHWNKLKLGTGNCCHNGELCMFAEHRIWGSKC